MELELKHLAPYLPYGLKLSYNSGDLTFTEPLTMAGSVIIESDKHCLAYGSFKPILRPLSDFNGSEADEEINSNSLRGYISVHDKFYNLDFMIYSDVQTLIKHHFDVFGLIPAGLAIDINTLPNQS